MNCVRENDQLSFHCKKVSLEHGFAYLLGDLARFLAFGRCLSQRARTLGFLHCT
jgi:hypothetical protein